MRAKAKPADSSQAAVGDPGLMPMSERLKQPQAVSRPRMAAIPVRSAKRPKKRTRREAVAGRHTPLRTARPVRISIHGREMATSLRMPGGRPRR